MSTCPERELLCVYVDGELPEKYRIRLETHIAGCENCKRHLTQLEMISQALRKDAASLSFSDQDLDAGFERLKTKQKYRRIAILPEKRRVSPLYGLGAMAAAAVLTVILPLQIKSPSSLPHITLTDKIQTTPLLHEQGVASADSATLAAFASYNGKTSENPAVSVNLTGESLATIDIFRPDLPAKAITITINLESVPGILPDDAHYWQQTGGTPVSFSAADYQ